MAGFGGGFHDRGIEQVEAYRGAGTDAERSPKGRSASPGIDPVSKVAADLEARVKATSGA